MNESDVLCQMVDRCYESYNGFEHVARSGYKIKRYNYQNYV